MRAGGVWKEDILFFSLTLAIFDSTLIIIRSREPASSGTPKSGQIYNESERMKEMSIPCNDTDKQCEISTWNHQSHQIFVPSHLWGSWEHPWRWIGRRTKIRGNLFQGKWAKDKRIVFDNIFLRNTILTILFGTNTRPVLMGLCLLLRKRPEN